jgi:hypothetical protein
MWFCVVSCHLLWFTFTKAIFNVLWKKVTGARPGPAVACKPAWGAHARARVCCMHTAPHTLPPPRSFTLAGGVTSFKATDKKVVNKAAPQLQQGGSGGAAAGDSSNDAQRRPWHGMQNLGDMEGTWDAWVLFASFAISAITAAVGVFQMVDKPFTAQVGGPSTRACVWLCVRVRVHAVHCAHM